MNKLSISFSDRKGAALAAFLSIASCIVLFITEQVAPIEYIWKAMLKVIMFVSLPIGFAILTSSKTTFISRVKSKDVKRLIILSLVSFASLLITYLALKSQIDMGSIGSELRDKLGITKSNYLIVGAFIIFGNSLLEEFFFRGFVFHEAQKISKGMAYLFSSALFALYHIGIFLTWFSLPIIILAELGLFAAGILFCYLNAGRKSITSSWIVHLSADLAIIAIGYFTLFNY